MNKNFWIGTEVEGRLKGIKTLFIVGDQDILTIENICEKYNISHLYFGAGNQSLVKNFKTLSYFSRQYFITYEVEHLFLCLVPKIILKNKNIHIVVDFQSCLLTKLKDTDSIKVEDKNTVFMSSICTMYKTNKSKDYLGDRFV